VAGNLVGEDLEIMKNPVDPRQAVRQHGSGVVEVVVQGRIADEVA